MKNGQDKRSSLLFFVLCAHGFVLFSKDTVLENARTCTVGLLPATGVPLLCLVSQGVEGNACLNTSCMGS